jgi:hypothetical protein
MLFRRGADVCDCFHNLFMSGDCGQPGLQMHCSPYMYVIWEGLFPVVLRFFVRKSFAVRREVARDKRGSKASDTGSAKAGQNSPRYGLTRLTRLMRLGLYLDGFLNSSLGQSEVGNITIQVTRQRLSLGDFKEIRVPLPPIRLQNEFAARVTEIRALETAQADSRRRLDDLFQSMLHKAFNGEL